MNIVERAKRLCLSPAAEWPVIAGERATLVTLMTEYVLPLAALSAIGSFLGSVFSGQGLAFATRVVITDVVVSLVGVVTLSVVIDALAPTFGAVKSHESAARVAAYAPTPTWVAGVFHIIPPLGRVIALAGILSFFYQLYVGLMRVMKSPQDKAVGYALVVILIALVVLLVVGYVTSTSVGLGPTFL
jgi:hypothetical protein